MNFRSFNIKTLLAAAAAVLTIVFAAPASAECVLGCVPTTSTPPAVTTQSLNFTVGGSGNFSGNGAALFQGGVGYAITEKTGGANVEAVITAAGELCGASCQNGGFTFKGMSFENVMAGAGAKSIVSGEQVSVVNQGAAFSNMNFQFMKLASPVVPVPVP